MTASEWLAGHVDGAPRHLLDAMLAAIPDSNADIPEALAQGAVSLYRTALSGAGDRADAFPLLAADALLTHAFEAQAELAPEGLVQFARRSGGAGRLAELLG